MEAYNTPVPAKPKNITVLNVRSGSTSVSKKTDFIYTTNGLVSSQVEFPGLPKAVTTTYSYDAYGNTTNISMYTIGIAPRYTNFTYDAKGRFLTRKQLAVWSSIEQSETYQYHVLWGKPISITSSDCLTTTFQYDVFGRLTTTSVPQGYDITTSYNWDINDNQVYYVMETIPGKPDTKTWYNNIGQVTKRQQKGFNNQWLTQADTYNDEGQIITSTNWYYSTETPLSTTFTYDKYNRIKTQANTFGTTSYGYIKPNPGEVRVQVTNAAGQVSSKTIDASGKVTKADDDGGTVFFDYDSWGNQTSVKHGTSQVITNAYDQYGRQTQMTDIDAGTITYNYDAYGELVSQTDANGNTYQMSYDLLGRLISRQGPEGATTYTYYKDATTGCSNNNPSVITGFNGVKEEYTYDIYNRATSKKETIDGVIYNTKYGYNKYDDITKITYKSGLIVTNAYDANGYLLTVTANDGTNTPVLFTGTAMNGFGQYTSYTLGSNPSSQSTYYYGIPTQYSTAGIQNLKFTFDYTTGNLTKRQDFIAGKGENFTYDNLNRLTGWSSISGVTQGTLSYDWNGNNTKSLGNIVNKSDAGDYTYRNNQIHATAYITNPAGATVPPANISTTQQDITYTPFLKTATITEGSNLLTFTYGPGYERVKSVFKVNNVVNETKYYVGNYEKQVTTSTTREIHYVSGGNGLCAIIVKENGLYKYYYTYTDYLGNILTVTDASGTIIAKQSFDPWGRYRNPDTWSYNNIPTSPEWLYRGFTGHEHLPKFGLINMNGRMYSPVTGRMLSADNYVSDPFSTQGYNRYSYAGNNPLVYTDPDGNFFWLAIPIFAGVNLAGDLIRNDFKMDIGDIGLSLFKGAVQGAFAGAGIGGSAITSWQAAFGVSISGQLPSLNKQIGDLSLSLSPALMYGNSGWGFGANVSASMSIGDLDVGVAGGYSYGESWITGIRGNEFRLSGMIGAHSGDFGFGLTSTNFYSGRTSQRVGGGYLNVGDFSLQYENDWFWGLPNGDNGDRFRTTGLKASYKDFSVGLNLFTGEPAVDKNGKRIQTEISPGQYQYVEAGKQYRLGAFYLGYENYRFGINSERVRNLFQNHLIHKDGYKFPIFQVLNRAILPYYSYQTSNPFTTW